MKRSVRSLQAAVPAAIALAFFVFSWALRYNEPEGGFAGLLDDHFFYVVRGWQMLYGEWPDRDFVDIGAPLTFVLSAAVQMIGGRGTLPEIVLCVTLLSAAAALSFYAAARASGSIVAAAAATLFHIALAPRLYNYSKLISYALAIPATWALIDRPTWPRRVALAVVTIVALLLRHDHGIFVAVFAGATVLLSRWSWKEKRQELIRYALLSLVLVLPYLVYLQIHGGIVEHFVTANAWSMRDRGRAPLLWPALFTSSLVSWLFYLLVAIPFVAGALLWRSQYAWRPLWPEAKAKLAGVAILALMLNVGFLRGALGARLGDVIVPHTILIAWLLVVAIAMVRGRAAATLRAPARLAVALLIIVALAVPSVPLAAELTRRLEASHIALDPGYVLGRMQEITARFQQTWPLERWASPTNNPSTALMFYLDACTRPEHRVFVSQYMPQVPALARRAFAGGHPDLRPGFFATDEDQRLFVERIGGQHVPVLIVPPTGEYEQFAQEFPLVEQYFAARYGPVIDRDLGETRVGIRTLKEASPRGRYEPLDLPCFR
ncbi:MAG: hypothetical protein ACREUC_04685 [Steroidobacteraceae bacterium]